MKIFEKERKQRRISKSCLVLENINASSEGWLNMCGDCWAAVKVTDGKKKPVRTKKDQYVWKGLIVRKRVSDWIWVKVTDGERVLASVSKPERSWVEMAERNQGWLIMSKRESRLMVANERAD